MASRRSTDGGGNARDRASAPANEPVTEGPQRVQKLLAAAGVASRRASEEIILEGRVTLNGVVVESLATKADPAVDVIEVNGKRIELLTPRRWFALHKPAGYVTTMDDPQGRETVVRFFPKGVAGLYPVGRLDRDTEGLLLLTNDGALAARLLHPRHHVTKTYRVWVDGVPDEADLRRLREGVSLDDGMTSPAEARVVARERGGAIVELAIREGRKRQVRRMCSAVGHPVTRLVRVSFGPLDLAGMAPGEIRELTAGEVEALRGSTG
ncbi:MAG: pseudouridine synthase [Coriobacteriia bacterium]|nr:pseudouridine synthase [Coriobacteriia bacterium]